MSKVVNGFLAASIAGGARSIAVDPWGRWADPEREYGVFVHADPSEFCRRVVRSAPAADGVGAWEEQWRRAESAAQAALEQPETETVGLEKIDQGGGVVTDIGDLSR